ncbi:MAG TPA: acyloxyacyl hydrolase [Verrucomicrobiae bacterium]|nr:acyloxyacyl hydrolase [Verrucomicrobiae bacterium]
MRKALALGILGLAIGGWSGADLSAGEYGLNSPMVEQDIPHGPWDEEGFEFTFITGPFFGPAFGVEGGRETLDYFSNSFRLGLNLTGIIGDSWYRGCFQFVGEIFVAEIFKSGGDGGGSIVVGPNALFRYNFVQENWPVVPYIQLGPGLVYTDTKNNAIGSAFGFQLNIGVGLRFMINDKWAVSGEFDWHHMSNAGFAEHNAGSNEAGGQLGISYFFF